MPVVEGLLCGSILLLLLRLWRGPTAWDRLLAYNSASNRAVLVLAVSSIALDEPVFLDVAITYAALSFLGVVVLSRFLEREGGFR
jgi:multicomponent Na+:H+ antiporter subunit F